MSIFNKLQINILLSASRQRIINEGAWIATGQIVSAIGTLVGIRLLTQYVPPPVFGSVNLLIGILALLYGLMCGPAVQSIVRYYSEAAQKNKTHLLRHAINRILRARSLLLIGTILFIGIFYAVSTKISYWVFVLLAGLLIVDIVRGVETSFLSAARRQKPYASWNAAEAWFRPSAAIIVVMLLGATLQAVLTGYVVASLLGLTVFFAVSKREGIVNGVALLERDLPLEQEIRRYALPLIPLAIVGWISSLSDRYIIGGLLGLGQVGIYAAAYGLVSRPFLMAGAIIELTLRPIYFDAISAGKDALEKKIINVWLGITVAVCAVGVISVTVLRNQIGNLLLAENYRNAVSLMPWIALGYSLLVVSYVFEKPCYAYKRTKAVLYIQTSGAIASICIAIPLVYYRGLQGAAVAIPLYFGTQLLFSIYMARQARR
jgi:O-antigen/teichoic acid export membrane protein